MKWKKCCCSGFISSWISHIYIADITGVTLADNSGTSANEVTLYLDAIDAEGNTYSRIVTLPVQ